LRITKVYTKTGDDGTTGLVGGERVPKTHQRIESYGAVDELNAALGLARAHILHEAGNLSEHRRHQALEDLSYLQNLLFTVGCDLAVRIKDRWDGMPVTTMEQIADLENKIDAMNSELPPLEDFVLPTGTPAVAAVHLARTICRRAERETLRLAEVEPVGEVVAPFLNRLSDYLFVFSRWLAHCSGEEERTWKH
jgi:cob(I)alamin adenosyltransferase